MELLATAKIFGTFGLDGSLKIRTFSNEYEYLYDLDRVFIGNKEQYTEYSVDTVELRNSYALLKLKELTVPEEGKKLVGADIFVPRNKACPLGEGEFYINDICKMILVYKGELIGKVISVVEGGGSFLLEISEAASASIKYVPFRKEFISSIENGQIELMHRWILE